MSERSVDILIIGSGFSGLTMAMEARRCGFEDIAILEKADDVGGTWRDNTYPGVACDVPSHLYCFARHLNPDWSMSYAGGSEIWIYMRQIARDEGLYDLCHFGQTMASARWDGSRWQVQTEQGQSWSARVLVSGIGALHVPLIPDVPGFFSFPGPSFHSANWEHDLDLTGKRVAVIGTGASAIQFVPEIAKTAAHVTIFQRTAAYVLPRPDGPFRSWTRRLQHMFPFLTRIRRNVIFNVFELRHAMFRGKPWAVNGAMKMWRKSMNDAIEDPDLREILTPPYRIGCKRVLSSNEWYPALARSNVEVRPTGLKSVSYRTLTGADGSETDVDVVIWGTGFHVTDSLANVEFVGADGLALQEAWQDGMHAHLGTTTAGFPNLFFLLGPNTGLGHNSVVLMIEAQVAHVCRLLETMREEGLHAIAPRPEAQASYEAEIDARLSESVWQTGGCVSWYQDANGRNTTLWPGTVREFQKRMAHAGIEHYQPVPPVSAAPETPS